MADSDFLNWFSGFVDGEGCFVIYKHPDTGRFYPRFRLALRDDDLDILLKILETLQIGTIHRRPAYVSGTYQSRPQAIWYVASGKDCLQMVEIMDEYPLRSKKARDYAIWREAVLEFQKPFAQRDRAKMNYLHAKIRLVRSYEPQEIEMSVPDEIQLGFPAMEGL